ncbi:hypothetical protein U9M48_030318 [Paspalum notatum var. saurae]|uniref:PGG domain-containing protein n=1 Tax=Paspalum notatum var. saurae TaxID=547442 RepID=A0AAQ3U040_PASNO
MNDPSLAWILNMQDDDGNTALHLAVQGGRLGVFLALFGNPQVNVNLVNKQGQTPLDVALNKIPPSFCIDWNSEVRIRNALQIVAANTGVCRQDHFEGNYRDIHGLNTDYQTKELDKLKDSTQALSIGSVLIATVTFGAAFALPGGYKQDDHTDGGTPTLAGEYAFHAFMMANTVAFICSSIATIGFMNSGSALHNLVSRKKYFNSSTVFMHNSIIALTAAFALGVYTVLAPVAQKTAIAICVMSPLVVLYNFAEFWMKWAYLSVPLYKRKGLFCTLLIYMCVMVVNIITGLWLFMFIFIWAAYVRKNH